MQPWCRGGSREASEAEFAHDGQTRYPFLPYDDILVFSSPVSQMKTQSAQEALVISLMQQSFGAPFLFQGEKKGGGKEPFDLAWAHGNTTVVFFLTASADLEVEISHNINQARGFRRLWPKRVREKTLYGKNIFGDRRPFIHSACKYLLLVSVVSSPIGLVLHECEINDRTVILLSVSDGFLKSLCSFGGTIIDFLTILNLAIGSIDFDAVERKLAQERFSYICSAYAKAIHTTPADETGTSLQLGDEENLIFIHKLLAGWRVPPSYQFAIPSKEERDSAASAYGDLSAGDYYVVAALAAATIHKSENQKYSFLASTNGLYTDFVIGAFMLDSSNFKGATEKLIEATRGPSGEPEKFSIIYGWPKDLGDYRSPLMMGYPKKRRDGTRREKLMTDLTAFLKSKL